MYFAARLSVLLGGGGGGGVRTTPTTPLHVDLLISRKYGSNHVFLEAQLLMHLQMSALLLFWKAVSKVIDSACGQ